MATSATARRRGPLRRLVSALLVLAAVVLALLAGAALLIQSRIDPEALRTRIERQAFESTGRTLSLGSAHLSLLPVPTLFADKVALAGLPGDVRPQMLTASSVSAHLALWPLLHHVARLDGLTLTDPDLSLQRDAAGNANWRFQPPDRARRPGDAQGDAGPSQHWRVEVGSLRVRDGVLAWRDAQHGWSGNLTLDRLDATGLGGDRPTADLAGRHGAAAFTASVQTGTLRRLDLSRPALPAAGPGAGAPDATADATPWPVRLAIRTSRNDREDVSLLINGTLADPARLRGFLLSIRLDAAHADGLDALFPHAAVPTLGPVALQANLVDDAAPDAPAAEPVFDRLNLRAGRMDVGNLVHRGWSQGLVLDRLSIDAAGRAAPVAVAADGAWRGQPVSIRGTAGTLDAWRLAAQAASVAGPARAGPGRAAAGAPFDLHLQAGQATATLTGNADPARLDLALQAHAPALRTLLPVGPALTGMSVSARIGLGPDRRVAVSGLDLASDQLALTGDAVLVGGPHPAIEATLASARMDLDALRAGWVEAAPAGSQPSGRTGAIASSNRTASAPPGASGPAGIPPATLPVMPAEQDGPVPPGEHALPFARLRCCDAAVALKVATLRFDGESYKDAAATLSLHQGVLSVSPVTANGPAGPIGFSLGADADRRTITLVVQPSMLPARTLADWLHQDRVLDGPVELVAVLQSAGATVEALLRSASGHAGLSMVDGSIADAALSRLLGRADLARGGNGRTAFRCLALPAVIADGRATLDPIALSTARLVVQGRGTVTLSDGGLDLHLSPRLSIGATGASLPVRIGGTLRAPEAALDPAAPGGRFTLTIGGGAPPDPCPAGLQAARYGAAGAMPGTAPEQGRHKLPKPIDILRGLGLFR